MEAAAKAFLMLMIGLPAFAAVLAATLVWRGYVLSLLWGWFMVPGFGAQALSVPLAIGLSTLIGLLTSHRSFNEATDPAKKWMPAFVMWIGPALTLMVGWVVKQYL